MRNKENKKRLDHEYYLKNRAVIDARTRVYQITHSEKVREWGQQKERRNLKTWREWFKLNELVFPKTPVNLYHHSDPDNKAFNISSFVRKKAINPINVEILEEELEKCVLVNRAEHARIHKPRLLRELI